VEASNSSREGVQWYIVNTLSGYEHKVAKLINEFAEKKGILNKFEKVIVPVENITEVRKGKKKTGEKKIFPGYIFIKMQLDNATWNMVKNIPSVGGFLGGSGKPVSIPEKEVMRVLKQVEEGAVAKEVELTFDIGEIVKIVEGPFETFTGVVDEIDNIRKRLKISVSIFGRPTPVDLEFNQVEKFNK
jgi:transcription termination/antitermination protein NusG